MKIKPNTGNPKTPTVQGYISALILVLTLLVASTAYAGHATLFVYHKFGEAKSPSTSISIEVFEAQLSYLQKNKYNVIGLPELVSILEEKRERYLKRPWS